MLHSVTESQQTVTRLINRYYANLASKNLSLGSRHQGHSWPSLGRGAHHIAGGAARLNSFPFIHPDLFLMQS